MTQFPVNMSTTTITTTSTHSRVLTSPLPPPPPTPSALSTLLSTQPLSNHLTPTEALPLEILHNLQHQHSWTSLRLHHLNQNASSPTTSKPSPNLLTSTPTFLRQAEAEAEPESEPEPEAEGLRSSISHLDLSTSTSEPIHHGVPLTLLSGIPPKPLYTHPDLQLQLLRAGIRAEDQPAEREWVLPTTLARKWSLGELCRVFDALPERAALDFSAGKAELGDRATSTSTPPSAANATATATSGGKGDEASRTGRSSGRARVRHQDAKRVLLAMRAREGQGGDGTLVYYIVQEGEVKPRQN